MKRTSYQQGTVTRKTRKRSPDLWVLRYCENGGYRSMEIGTVDKFRTKGAARKEADKKLIEINERLAGIKVSGLCDRFTLECDKETSELRVQSVATYKSFAKRVRLDLGESRVDELAKDLDAIETWVIGYRTLGTPDRVVKGKTIAGQPPRTPARGPSSTSRHSCTCCSRWQ
jgi:hypothetical protein